MSASITAAPARTSYGRLPLALATLALVVVAALAVAIVAMNSAKAVAPATSAAKGAPPAVKYLLPPRIGPSAIDYGQSVSNVPFYDHGWSIAGTSATPSTGTGYPLFGASYFQSVPLRIHAIDEGARGDRVIEPQYVAPRPRNQ